jgi:hypothetical protein
MGDNVNKSRRRTQYQGGKNLAARRDLAAWRLLDQNGGTILSGTCPAGS